VILDGWCNKKCKNLCSPLRSRFDLGEACQHHLGVDIFKHGRGVMSTILGVALRQDQHTELPEMEAAFPTNCPAVDGFCQGLLDLMWYTGTPNKPTTGRELLPPIYGYSIGKVYCWVYHIILICSCRLRDLQFDHK